MKNSVTVDGIVLTREQVETAWIDLQTPEPPKLRHFQRLRRRVVTTESSPFPAHTQGRLIVGCAQETYWDGLASEKGRPRWQYTVITDSGFGDSYPTVTRLLGVWETVNE